MKPRAIGNPLPVAEWLRMLTCLLLALAWVDSGQGQIAPPAGDLLYRRAVIDFNDKEVDQTDKIISDLTMFLSRHPDDLAAGAMNCLLGDTYQRKKSDKADEMVKFKRLAIDTYKNAVWSNSPDDVIQYALDSATALMKEEKDWSGIAEMHARILKEKPDSSLAMLSATWVAKMKAREGKDAEAAAIFVEALKANIGNPAREEVEALIDELVKSMIPKGKKADIDFEAIDKQLADLLNGAIGDQQNATTNARLYYARARLAESLKRREIAERFLKGIAIANEKQPEVLSPALLAIGGDVLLKEGKLDSAEAMYRRLVDHFLKGTFADAGTVGLGKIALAEKKPEEALKIFENAIALPGMARIKEATLGKLEALVDLGKFDEAEKLALDMVGNDMFRGEPAAQAYLLMAKARRARAAKEAGVDARLELLKQAYAIYLRVYTAYKSTPVVCAEAGWQAYETELEIGNQEGAKKMLASLRSDPKLKGTPRQRQAETMSD